MSCKQHGMLIKKWTSKTLHWWAVFPTTILPCQSNWEISPSESIWKFVNCEVLSFFNHMQCTCILIWINIHVWIPLSNLLNPAYFSVLQLFPHNYVNNSLTMNFFVSELNEYKGELQTATPVILRSIWLSLDTPWCLALPFMWTASFPAVSRLCSSINSLYLLCIIRFRGTLLLITSREISSASGSLSALTAYSFFFILSFFASFLACFIAAL